MTGIRRIISGAKALALAGAMSACASGLGTGLDGEYPPYTDARKQQVEAVLLSSVENNSRIVQGSKYGIDNNDTTRDATRPAMEFEDGPQEFAQRLYEMANDDMESKGLSTFPLQDISIQILPPKEVMKFCGEKAAACNYKDQIRMMDNNDFLTFLSTLFHETGHSYSPGNMEFVSQSSEMLMKLKAYQFSRPIGSMMAYTAISQVSDTPLDQREPFFAMYAKGTIFAVANLLNNNCDIEAALDHVGNSRTIITETELERKLSEMEGTLSDKYFQMWNEVLGTDNFKYSLMNAGHMDWNEAYELAEYLRILNYANKYVTEDMTDEAKEIMKALDEPFALSPYNNNPFFKSQSVYRHTKALHDDIEDIASLIVSPETYVANQGKIFDLSRKILILNSRYPCETKDPYACPILVRHKRYDHADAYYQMMMHAGIDDTDQMEESIGYLKEFMGKFYPGTDIENGMLGPLYNTMDLELNNYFPSMALRAANYYFTSDMKEKAENFLRAAVAIACVPDWWHSIQECQNSKQEALNIMQAYGMRH